jgi:hypothetical protein
MSAPTCRGLEVLLGALRGIEVMPEAAFLATRSRSLLGEVDALRRHKNLTADLSSFITKEAKAFHKA